MSVKLTEIATQALIDNVTSITPGALKGGCSLDPASEVQYLSSAGGSDGLRGLYRVFRERLGKSATTRIFSATLFRRWAASSASASVPTARKNRLGQQPQPAKDEIVVASFD